MASSIRYNELVSMELGLVVMLSTLNKPKKTGNVVNIDKLITELIAKH